MESSDRTGDQRDAESRDNRISDEAVAAAAAISSKVCPGRPWGDTDDADKPHYREDARAALAAAVPHMERQIRESIAGAWRELVQIGKTPSDQVTEADRDRFHAATRILGGTPSLLNLGDWIVSS